MKSKIAAGILALFLVITLLGASCKETIISHIHKNGDNYCTYSIKEVSGGGTLQVNDRICIYCGPSGPDRCGAQRYVEVSNGPSYRLGSSSNYCTDCPNKNLFEVK